MGGVAKGVGVAKRDPRKPRGGGGGETLADAPLPESVCRQTRSLVEKGALGRRELWLRLPTSYCHGASTTPMT